MTAPDAAAHLHMDQSSLNRLENGKSPYNQRQIEALAELYRCRPGDLLSYDPTKPDDLRAVIDALMAAPAALRAIAVKSLKGILEIV